MSDSRASSLRAIVRETEIFLGKGPDSPKKGSFSVTGKAQIDAEVLSEGDFAERGVPEAFKLIAEGKKVSGIGQHIRRQLLQAGVDRAKRELLHEFGIRDI